MATWQDYIDQFSADLQPVIEALQDTYDTSFSITDYEDFAILSDSSKVTNFDELSGTDPFLVALATWYLDSAVLVDQTVADPWEVWIFPMAIEDQGAARELQTYYGASAFDDFAAMTASELAGDLAGLDPTENLYWSKVVSALKARSQVIAPSTYKDFYLSLPLDDRTAYQAMIATVTTEFPSFDLDTLRESDTKGFVKYLKKLNATHRFLWREAQKYIGAMRTLLSENTPEDELEGRFYGSFEGRKVDGAQAFWKTYAASVASTNIADIGSLSIEGMAEMLVPLSGTHVYYHGMAEEVLERFHIYDASLAEAPLPWNSIVARVTRDDNDAPLFGYAVRVLDMTGEPFLMAIANTDHNGIFRFGFEGDPGDTLPLRYDVYDLEENFIVSSSTLNLTPATSTQVEFTVTMPAAPSHTITFAALETAAGITIPSGLETYLAGEEIATLEDLRMAGGISHRSDTAVTENLAMAQKLDSHAQYELISQDYAFNEFLIGEGFTGLADIAGKSRTEFVETVVNAEGSTYGEVSAGQMQYKAANAEALLRQLSLGHAARQASGYKFTGGTEVRAKQENIEALFSRMCTCEECISGVSPLAYLAALLDYGTKYLKDDGVAVDVDWFQTTFHQSYCELPATCAAAEKRVCQVRIAIETLRRAMSYSDITYSARREYLQLAYELLLNQAGTTFDEVRILATGGQYAGQVEDAVARLGLLNSTQLQALYLDSTAAGPSLTEAKLEELFGLQSTLRNPYSDGLKIGDSGNLVYSWMFEGVEWKRHTDGDGFIYIKIEDSPDTVTVYKDSARTVAIATGVVSSASPYTAVLHPVDNSGFSGRIELTASPSGTNTAISILVVPKLVAWRLQGMRNKWIAQDGERDTNGYIQVPANRLYPYIEPDWMGPDDIRDPFQTAGSGLVTVYEIWENRRGFLDGVMADLVALGNDVEGMFDSFDDVNWTPVYNETNSGSPVGDEPWETAGIPSPFVFTNWETLFSSLQTALQGGPSTTYNDAVDVITGNLRLTLDSFGRLNTLYLKYQDPGFLGFGADELNELRNILLQVVKNAYYAAWIQEEDTEEVTLGPALFWPSLHAPQEGEWNTPQSPEPFHASSFDMPWIDPAVLKLRDLGGPILSADAIDLYLARETELADKLADIYAESADGYADMFEEALGVAIPTPPAGYADLEAVLEELNAPVPDPDVVDYVHEELFLTEVEFREAMVIVVMTTPSATGYARLAELLLNAYRRGTAWAAWKTAETSASVTNYWQVLKQRIPAWRGSLALRREWTDALAFFSSRPLVDPDLIKPGDIARPVFYNDANVDNPAYLLWRDRDAAINGSGGWLATITGAASISVNVVDVIGSTLTELEELQDLVEQHKDVSGRLAQLGLTPERLAFILKVNTLGGAATDVEEAAMYDIFLQIQKSRNYGTWHLEEMGADLTLSGDYFVNAYENYYDLQQYVAEVLNPWRASLADRREWQDRLQSRLDQAASLINGQKAAVQATEDRTLILLRDALILNGSFPGNTLSEKAEALTELLLMDFKIQCCQETTRVAQAIETLQNLYHSVRTGIIVDDYPYLDMSGADDFDDDWQWLGSYGAWRSLVFTYLYPENLLMPSYRGKKSPVFQQIIADVRNNSRLTPEVVCEKMREYQTYLEDLVSLTLQATAITFVDIKANDCQASLGGKRNMNFMFALGSKTARGYWSAHDQANTTGFAQTFWTPIPGFEKLHKIIGAEVYKVKSGLRFLYVFGLKTIDGDQPQLCVNRMRLDTMRWESDLEDLKVDQGPMLNNKTLKVAHRKEEAEAPYLIAESYPYNAIWGYNGFEENLSDLLGYDADNRFVKYNQLDEEGRGWASDEWKGTEFVWFNTFNLVAAYSPQKDRLVMLAHGKFPLGSPSNAVKDYLVYHEFHTGPETSGSSLARIMPKFSPPVISTSTNAATIQLFQDYIYQSEFVRIVYDNGSPTPNPLNFPYTAMVGIWKSASNTYTLIYKESTNRYGLKLEETEKWYKPTNGAFNTNKAPKHYHTREIVCTQKNPYLSVRDFMGPCFEHLGAIGFGGPNGFAYQEAGLIGVEGAPFIRRLASPNIQNIYSLNEAIDKSFAISRRAAIDVMFAANSFNTAVNRAYLEEAYYFLPIFLALELQQQRYFTEALDLYRLVYDYRLPIGNRKIYYGLRAEETIATTYSNILEWLEDPENPHAIAGTRANAYTRFTICAIVRCFLEMADQEFTRDTSESVPRARILYLTAVELIKEEIYLYEGATCAERLSAVDVLVTDAGWRPAWERLKAQIAELNDDADIDALLDGDGTYDGILAEFVDTGLTWEERFTNAAQALDGLLGDHGSTPNRLCTTLNDYPVWGLFSNGVIANHPNGGTLMEDMNSLGTEWVGKVARITGESVEDLLSEDDQAWLAEPISFEAGNGLTLDLGKLLKQGDGVYAAYYETYPGNALRQSGAKRPYIPYASHYFCVPRNPVPHMLLLNAELNLFKIRNCRNIAGVHRELEPYAAATDSISGLPMIGANGQISFPATVSVPPTPYRFEVLLMRAKELASMAQQAEAALLSALEKRDAEYYTLMRARQDARIARATVRLQDLRVKEAEDSIDLAELQRDRSQLMIENYDAWLSGGDVRRHEENILNAYTSIAALRVAIAGINFAQQQISYSLAIASAQSSPIPTASTAYASMAAPSAMLNYTQTVNQIGLAISEHQLSISQVMLSRELREQQWRFELSMAQHDWKIGAQGVKLAHDRLRIVGQERNISQMQADHADEVIEFLTQKFTNAELYEWMSGVLERIFSYYLQQATGMAKIAQQQLAFERQEAPPAIVQDDYWVPQSDLGGWPGDEENAAVVDRKGLTGSARLLQDITRLDLYAFQTNQRKLQLTKTISLAQYFPAEFEVFKQTGILHFRTGMQLFDRDFPGHYLRLIKRVRTSVLALIPPGEGIRARLSSAGNARVVVRQGGGRSTGGSFQNIVQARGTESVSLTSPIEATGLFELQPQQTEFLNPFEGMGVDTSWEFRMQRAANPIDFSTVADVLLTLEYTALESFDYEQEVVRGLNPVVSGDRAFSMRYAFPDQWFDLNNPLQISTPHVVNFDLRRADFPANLTNLKIAHISVMLVMSNETDRHRKQVGLHLADAGGSIGGVGTSNDMGMISTRWAGNSDSPYNIYNGNANQWVGLIGKNPVGTYTLDLTQTGLPGLLAETNPGRRLEDVLLIVTYKGDGPAYLA